MIRQECSVSLDRGDDWITVQGEEFLASTFLASTIHIRTREFYAELILEYLGLVAFQDVSISDVNEQIDDRTLEYGAEIHKQLF